MKQSEFRAMYIHCLHEAMLENPGDYGMAKPGYTPSMVEQRANYIGQKMMQALSQRGPGGIDIRHSDGFRKMAKKLGIKHTVRDISAAWNACEKD